jgi:hypothetical protein
MLLFIYSNNNFWSLIRYEKSTFIATAAFAFTVLLSTMQLLKISDLDKVVWTLLRFLLIIKFRIVKVTYSRPLLKGRSL